MIERVKLLFYFTSVIAGFVITFYIATQSFQGEEFITASEIMGRSRRDIANIKKTTDNLGLMDHFLVSSSPVRSLTQANMTKTNNFFQLTLGHFSTTDKRGEPAFACQVYDRVLITYESLQEAETEATRPQKMTLEFPCKLAEDDIKHLISIKLTPSQFLKEPPSDGVFPTLDNGEVSIRFENVEDRWPKQWLFKSVAFIDSHRQYPNKEVSVLDLPQKDQKKLNMDWSQIVANAN